MNTQGQENIQFIAQVNPVQSIIYIGDLQIHNCKKWHWLHRKMMALCFGWRVENKTTP